MANKVRFVDNVGVNAFGNTNPEALITASGGVGSIVFTRGNGQTITLPLAATQSSADSLTTASVAGNIITFTKGDSSTFTITVDTGSGGAGGSVNTGSLLTTGSVSNNVLTFTKGDGSTFTMTVDTGSGEPLPSGVISSSTQITELGFVTSSATASFVTNSQTGSFITNSQTSSMSVATASFALFAISASHEIIKEVSSSHANFADTASKSLDNVLTASVSSNTITFTKGDNSTFALTVDTGSSTSIDTGSFITNAQTSSMSVGTASIANFIPFDGNRAVSNQDQPTGIKNVNFNANGLADFIEKVYFTNTAPTILTTGFTIGEFVASGSLVGFVTASDAESGSQTITFSTSSTYTADQFRIHSGSGKVTLNVKSTSSMNTVNDSGSLKAPLPIIATDSFGATGSRTIFIRVTPNTAPIWSEVEDGSLTTSLTASLSESSAQANDKDRYYFRDDESDTITIGSGSFSPHFTTAFRLVRVSNYVRLDQITASLDFDTFPSYSFVLTASDEHYESGDDPNSIAYLPVKLEILDNLPPTIGNQTLAGVNESSSANTSAGTDSATDPEGLGSITFSGFALKSAFLNSDPSNNLTSSLGGVSLLNPSSNPFQINSGTGQVTRKAGQFLNVDIADRYVYTTTVRDNFNLTTNSAEVTIPIANHSANTLSISSNAFIIESAISGNLVSQNSVGFGGSNTTLTAANSSVQRFNVTSVPDFLSATSVTGSSTTFGLKTNLSSSATTFPGSIILKVTASQDNFETTVQTLEKTVTLSQLQPPTFATSSTTTNFNTNGARVGNTLVQLNITDPQSFSLNHNTFNFIDASGQLTASRSGDNYIISPKSDLSGSTTYNFTASIENVKGFRSGSVSGSFTVSQASVGTLTTNGSFFVIESAVNGANIVLNSNGRTGTQGDLGANYSPQFNSQAVQSFTSSNAAIAVASNGNLTLGVSLSGSSTGSGDTISSNITYVDQFSNIGSGSISVSVTLNQAPNATMNLGAISLLTSSLAVSGSIVASLTGSDPQSFENITSASLFGISSSRFNLVDKTGASTTRRYEIQPTTDLAAGTYPISGSVVDAFSKSGSANLNITIAQYPNIPEVYIYSSTRGASAPIPANYNSLLGDETTTGTPIKEWASGSLGNEGPITLSGGVMRLIGSASAGLVGSDLNTIVSSTIGVVNPAENEAGNHLIYIVYPSGSDPRLAGVPTTMTDAFGGSTVGEYVMYYFNNSIDKGIVGSQLNSFTLQTGVGYTASNGTVEDDYSNWTVLGCNNSKFSATATRFYVVPSSGSAPADP